MLCTSLVHADDPYWVSLASFHGESNAEDFVAAQDNAHELTIRLADSPAGPVYRVLVGPYQQLALARDALGALRPTYASAWLLNEALIRPSDPNPLPTPGRAPAPAHTPPVSSIAQTTTTPVSVSSPSRDAQAPQVALADDLTIQVAAGDTVRISRIAHSDIRIDGFVVKRL